MTTVRVVTVTHNSSHIIGQFLADLDASGTPGARLVVVDSGSKDAEETGQAVAATGGAYLRVGENVGYGQGSNFGAASADEDWLFFVNPDVRISAHTLMELAEEANASGLDCVGPMIRNAHGIDQHTFRGLISPPWRRRRHPSFVGTEQILPTLSVSGCCLGVRRDQFVQLGGFDPRFFMFCEEIDLQARLLDAGGRIGIACNHVAVTDGGGSSAGVERRWSTTERSASHVTYVHKHFTAGEAAIDLTWRVAQILVRAEFRPRRESMHQFFTRIRAAHRSNGFNSRSSRGGAETSGTSTSSRREE